MTRQPLDTDRVVDAAAELADREGIDSVTLTRVADELGVRQPALYRHVDSYQDLIRRLGLRGREYLGAALAEAAIGVSGEDAVAAVGHAWRQLVADHPGLCAAADRSPCAGDAELEGAVDRIVDIVAQSLAGFGLDDGRRVHAARALWSAFHGFAHLESGAGHPHLDDIDETFDDMIELMCAGIRSQAE